MSHAYAVAVLSAGFLGFVCADLRRFPRCLWVVPYIVLGVSLNYFEALLVAWSLECGASRWGAESITLHPVAACLYAYATVKDGSWAVFYATALFTLYYG